MAYALPPRTREQRAEQAKVVLNTHFNNPTQVFLDFVLGHYVNVGVEEFAQEKLTQLLKLKYHDSITDALADLGQSPDEIRTAFSGFQKYRTNKGRRRRGVILAQNPESHTPKTKRSPAPAVHAVSHAVRRELRNTYFLFVAATSAPRRNSEPGNATRTSLWAASRRPCRS